MTVPSARPRYIVCDECTYLRLRATLGLELVSPRLARVPTAGACPHGWRVRLNQRPTSLYHNREILSPEAKSEANRPHFSRSEVRSESTSHSQ